MKPVDYIVIAIVAVIAALIIVFLVRAKLRGEKCIGCPHSKQCSGHCGGCGGCSGKTASSLDCTCGDTRKETPKGSTEIVSEQNGAACSCGCSGSESTDSDSPSDT